MMISTACIYACIARYMQEEIMEFLVPRHQAQGSIKTLIKVGHSVVNYYFIAGMQIR